MTNDAATMIPASQAIDLSGAIQSAAALGKDGVEVLERLHAIAKDERAAAARAAFFRATAELHGKLGSIHKNRVAKFNTRGGAAVSYRYADLHAIATALRKHTGPLGLAWRWETKGDERGVIVTCTASHRDGHSESSSWRAPIEGGNPMTSESQKAKIATTFAQRVTLIQVFGLTDTEDDVDGAMPEGRVEEDHSPGSANDEERESALANLRATMEEVGGDPTRFLKWLGVERVDDLGATGIRNAFTKLAEFKKAGRTM